MLTNPAVENRGGGEGARVALTWQLLKATAVPPHCITHNTHNYPHTQPCGIASHPPLFSPFPFVPKQSLAALPLRQPRKKSALLLSVRG